MTRSLRLSGALAATASLAALASPAAAQPKAGQPACDIDQNKPSTLGLAVLSITGVQNSPDTAVKYKALRAAVKRVSDDANAPKQNPAGTAFTLGQAFTLLAQDVRLANSATRADVGFSSNPTAPADLLKLVDSTMTVVETAKPNCASVAGQLREAAWGQTTNAALQALNAQQFDSAAKLAERGLVVYKKSPLSYYVLATTAQQKGDNARAAQYWPRVAEATASDTSQQARELRGAALQNLAILVAQVDAATGDAQKAKAREAAAAARAFVTANPTHPDVGRMQAQLARLLSLSGDKAGVSAVYAEMLREPAKYDDLALTNAGVIASQAQAHADAAKLFDAALAKNAYQRDALNNLTATYLELKRFDAMIPVARRLVAVDPANPDNQLFLALAYQGLMNAAKAPAQKKAFADSLVKYNQASQSMPVKVTFNEFTRGESRAVLGMNVEAVKPTAARRAPRAAPRPRPAARRRATRSPSSSSTGRAPWSTRSR
jgi:tetratricopeptide (TPR) repeat protein